LVNKSSSGHGLLEGVLPDGCFLTVYGSRSESGSVGGDGVAQAFDMVEAHCQPKKDHPLYRKGCPCNGPSGTISTVNLGGRPRGLTYSALTAYTAYTAFDVVLLASRPPVDYLETCPLQACSSAPEKAPGNTGSTDRVSDLVNCSAEDGYGEDN